MILNECELKLRIESTFHLRMPRFLPLLRGIASHCGPAGRTYPINGLPQL